MTHEDYSEPCILAKRALAQLEDALIHNKLDRIEHLSYEVVLYSGRAALASINYLEAQRSVASSKPAQKQVPAEA